MIDEVLDHLVPDDAPPPRDRRVVRALDILHAAPRPPRLVPLAAAVSLSPSRFAHLFRAHTGLPVRRYALWARLIHAIRLVAGGTLLTTAAHEAAFADSAHLTRTFRRMLGMPPSVLRSIGTVLRSGAPVGRAETADEFRWNTEPGACSAGCRPHSNMHRRPG